jgi:hypothetical protein
MHASCKECGMTSGRPFLGTPVCMLYPPEKFSYARKTELAERGCFRFQETECVAV